ncbi:MAG: YvcK family protein [Thermomicrobiales bacterium]|nr:YvcK family protein [Thermomicrobiales bacterium]
MELRSWRTWMRPGMLIKRWMILAMAGIIVISLGLAMGLTWAYRNYYWQLESTSSAVRLITLQFIPHPYREFVLIVPGVAMLSYGLWRLGHAVIGPILALTSIHQPISQIVANHRFGPNMPDINVVTIGGGTGLSHLLRGLKQHDLDITAIVTVADDGGSTGRIRREYDIPAPGDIRNCIIALADDESLVSQLFQYRFDRDGSDLKGHSLGNLFITALSQVTGSFEQAVLEFGKVVNIRGRVMPSTLANIDLCAELIDGTRLHGESKIPNDQAPIKKVYLEPDNPAAYPPALDAIINADLIILGPGSLYTSVIPNLLVSGIVDAIRWSRGTTVYACNVATQIGETDHFTATDHIRAVVEYLGRGNLDYAVVNSNRASAEAIKPELGVQAVLDDGQIAIYDGVKIVGADVISDVNSLRHDPAKLSQVLVSLTRPTGSVTPLPVDRIEARTGEPLKI